jgi:short-subunit dehydrogenase involved in D-alanine esterification of teichoic acids
MAMPLKDFIAETMAILEANPDVTEVLVERVKPQRCAEARRIQRLLQCLGTFPAPTRRFAPTPKPDGSQS